jgi:hypothetical protein
MTGHYVPSLEQDPEVVKSLRLTVRKLPHRPNRWAWDLRDSRDGSWFESMFEFDSHERARLSGLARIEELVKSASAATVTGARRDANEPIRLREAA